MAISLRDMPIKRKLTLVMLLTSSFALVLMGSGVITYELLTFRRSLAANMSVLAQIIGSNSTAALAFEDRKNAEEILGALAAEKQISAAAIYNRTGELFARFPNEVTSINYPAAPKSDGYSFSEGHLVMFQPIFEEGARLGTIFLRADLGAMFSRINVYGALLFVVGLCSFLGALILASTLQRRLSSPILDLANVAQAVSDRQDYSVRGVKHGQDEIGKLTDAFNQMLIRIGETTNELGAAKEAAESANEAKDSFLATLSHELRTPLTPVLVTLAMLRDDDRTPPHVLRDLEVIHRNIEIEARLIDDLLDVTRIIRGKLDLHHQTIDVRTLLEHAIQNFCIGVAAEKNQRLSLEVVAEETHVSADSSRLTQVLWNVLQNACKFTPAGGSIQIRISNEEQPQRRPDLVIEILDDGIGISPETIPRIFQAFEQGERSRSRVFGGLGLGLAISRAIVDLHSGSIAATSKGRNKGTKVTIRLPTVPAPAVREMEETGKKVTPEMGQLRSLRVLLVEDHRDTADQLTRLLERAGHEVICVGGVEEALGRGRNGGFDVLISDLGLPDGNGYDLMRDLTQAHPIPGIALSGFGMKDDVENSIAAGFSCHFTKPVDWQKLKTEIQKIAVRPG